MNAKNVHHDKIFKRCFGVLSISDAVILHGVFLKHHKKAFWSFKYISDTAILRGVFFYFPEVISPGNSYSRPPAYGREGIGSRY